MNSQRWLLLILISWCALSVAIGVAASREAVSPGLRQTGEIIVAVLAVGVVPLTWLGLTGQLSAAARGVAARMLGTAAGAGALVGVLLIPALVLFWWSWRTKGIEIKCEPCVKNMPAQLQVDDDDPRPKCSGRVRVRPEARIRVSWGDHTYADRALSDSEFKAGSATVPICDWSCTASTVTNRDEDCYESMPDGSAIAKEHQKAWKLHIQSVVPMPPELILLAEPKPTDWKTRVRVRAIPSNADCPVLQPIHPDSETDPVRMGLGCFYNKDSFDIHLSYCPYDAPRPRSAGTYSVSIESKDLITPLTCRATK